METETKVKLDKKMYHQLKKMLLSSDEDFEMACETLKNIEKSPNILILLAKGLVYKRRMDFIDIAGPIQLDDLSWETTFKTIKENNPSALDKEIVETEFTELIHSTLNGLDFEMIKKIKINLKW